MLEQNELVTIRSTDRWANGLYGYISKSNVYNFVETDPMFHEVTIFRDCEGCEGSLLNKAIIGESLLEGWGSKYDDKS